MHHVIQKLNFKDQPEVLILNSPDDFMQVLKEFENLAKVEQKIQPNKYEFILIFVKNLIEIKEVAIKIPSIMADDVTLWIAYPKKSSRKYTSDISRDNGWQPLDDLDFEGVRQIAIDEDWSALRFRQAKFIKSLKRDKTMVMSKEGKQKLNS